MLRKAVSKLALSSGDCVFDGTVGSAGHTRAICARLEGSGSIVGTDKDRQAVKSARKTLEDSECSTNYCLRVADFRDVSAVATACGVDDFQAAILDLGYRSEQLSSDRGFSFQKEAPLLMTYKDPDTITSNDITARDVINTWSKQSLVDILSGYADEQYAEEIAEAIVSRRKSRWIETTTDLVEAIKKAVPAGYQSGKRHPATKTFQAVRIAVNDEIRGLQEGLENIFAMLSEGARFVVISFHSTEDRIVKNYFRKWSENSQGSLIGDQPITPDRQETNHNPRSRSAKMRCIQKQV
jgi:16S rRNA (cytosine1402-N4)-methyltransferase